MVQGLYLYWKDVFNRNTKLDGIDNKVKDQITLFNDKGLNCTLLVCPRANKVNRILAMLPGTPDDTIVWPDVSRLRGADYIYMRRPDFVSREYIHWLKQVRQTYPNLKIIYEVPTYPYDGEWVGLRDLNFRIKDTWNRKKLKDYCDYIADLSGEKEIFGIPTLPMSNGVVLDRTPMREPEHRDFTDTVDILCVAYYSKWHGIDRFLNGMGQYYADGTAGKVNIRLHLVGGGDRRCLNGLKRLTAQHHIESHVTFHGPVPREKLDSFYDLCDFAIESLGVHRRKIIKYSYSIKSREYLAKGMPFIYSTPIDLEQHAPIPFCFKSTEDEQPVDVGASIDYYRSLYRHDDELAVARQLRAYAEQWVSLERALSSVTDFIASLDGHPQQ